LAKNNSSETGARTTDSQQLPAQPDAAEMNETTVSARDGHEPEPVRGDVYPLLYVFTRTVLWWLYNFNGGVTIEGAENVPASGGAIIAPNHVSHTDPPLIAITNRRPVTIMAKDDLFKIPVLGPYIDHLGTFPVKRGTADRVALRMALDRLAAGRLVLIFPEGTRGDGITLQPPERGMGLIAMKSGAPVIPTCIHGTDIMMPRGHSGIRRAKVGVTYGKPILPQSFSGRTAGDDLAKAVMEAVDAMRK
jgi:1-acyl-sn-glycerol-3-phosphate acyltransferase